MSIKSTEGCGIKDRFLIATNISPFKIVLSLGKWRGDEKGCSFKFNVTARERVDDESPIIGSVCLALSVSL